MKAMFAQAQQQGNKLEQDSMEGVDPDEWVCFTSLSNSLLGLIIYTLTVKLH